MYLTVIIFWKSLQRMRVVGFDESVVLFGGLGQGWLDRVIALRLWRGGNYPPAIST